MNLKKSSSCGLLLYSGLLSLSLCLPQHELKAQSNVTTYISPTGDALQAVEVSENGDGTITIYLPTNSDDPIGIRRETPDDVSSFIAQVMGWDMAIQDASYSISDIENGPRRVLNSSEYGLDYSGEYTNIGYGFIKIDGETHFSGYVGDVYFGEISDNQGALNYSDFMRAIDEIVDSGAVSELPASDLNSILSAYDLQDAFTDSSPADCIQYEEGQYFEAKTEELFGDELGIFDEIFSGFYDDPYYWMDYYFGGYSEYFWDSR
jgi:hypothetical protein